MALKTIIVTGANRGIGQAICHHLLAHSHTTKSPLRLLATSRAGQNLNFSPPSPDSEILYPKLDISDQASIKTFASSLAGTKIDVLINNAGVHMEDGKGKGNDYDRARKTLEVNYYGTKMMCLFLLPHFSSAQTPKPRIVTLSSLASSLAPYSEQIQARFRDPEATWKDLDSLAEEYLTSVHSQSETCSGFAPGKAYNISKSLVNSMTALLARENSELQINACCPGWIETEMGWTVTSGRTKPPKTPEQGAVIPVRLAVGNIGDVTGRYWANPNMRSKDDGQVTEW